MKIIQRKTFFLLLLAMVVAIGSTNLALGVRKTLKSAPPNVPLTSVTFGQSGTAKYMLLPEKYITFNTDANPDYIGTFKFDRAGNLYLLGGFQSGRSDIQWKLIKLGANEVQENNVIPKSVLGQGILDEFDIAPSGLIIGLFHEPDYRAGVFVLSSSGQVLSKFYTKDFYAIKVHFDSESNIWTAGSPTTDSRSPNFQIRVFNLKGELISTPLEGLTQDDIVEGLFLQDQNNVKFFNNMEYTVYTFAKQQLIGKDKGPVLGATETLSKRQLNGIFQFNGNTVWYGMYSSKDKDSANIYDRGYICLTNLSGQVTAAETSLPAQYSNVIGVDYEGNLYFSIEKAIVKAKLKVLPQ